MKLTDEIKAERGTWLTLGFYGKFEHAVILVLTLLIAVVIAAAMVHLAWTVVLLLLSVLIAIIALLTVWSLLLRVLAILRQAGTFDATDPALFQELFGMIFTVIIALEFKHSLLVALDRQHSVIQVRTIVLIAILAMVRKFIILDVTATSAMQLFGLAAAILALGIVYWLVRE